MQRDEFAPDFGYMRLFPPEPQPSFQEPDELERVWGARWGAADDVGPLRVVLMRRPGRAFEQMTADTLRPDLGMLVDSKDGLWYWHSETPPDIDLLNRQHAALVSVLEGEGVRVVLANELPPRFSNAMFVRDPLVTVRGGAIIGRPAPRMRRGEEVSITQTVAALGMPIIGTIVGTGLLEGGSFVKVRPDVAAFGLSLRCNQEGAHQLQEMLARLGVELIPVPLPGFLIHIDGALAMVDVDRALVHAAGLPYWFLERLQEMGIELLWPHPDEFWAINALAVRPGRIIMGEGSPRTVEMLERRGVEVVVVDYREVQKLDGGIHCSTMELVRDDSE